MSKNKNNLYFKTARIIMISASGAYLIFFSFSTLSNIIFYFLMTKPNVPVILIQLKLFPFVIIIYLVNLFFALKLKKIKNKMTLHFIISFFIIVWAIIYMIVFPGNDNYFNEQKSEKILNYLSIIIGFALMSVPQIIAGIFLYKWKKTFVDTVSV